MNWKTLKKAIFDSCKPPHIPIRHDREVYSLACSINALTFFFFIFIKRLNWSQRQQQQKQK
jgi:hypothetical protein